MAEKPDLFKTAPEEVLRYFRSKTSKPTFDWRDIAPQEHAFSWTVAKSTEHDILDDIRAATDDAIANRVPFNEFSKKLTPILQEKGWWGRKVVTDPKDGSDKSVQLGSPRRLKIIYWANTATAKAAGEWERTQRTKDFLPYLIYTRSRSVERRPEHESWVDIVLPVDDPWWNTHYPPNEWGCKCGVRQISRTEALKKGWSETTAAPPLDMRPWTNKRTGETQMVPRGIAPGWQTNPGKTRAANVSSFLNERIEAMPANRQRAAIDDIVASPIIKAMAGKFMPKPFYVPVAQIPAPALKALGAQKGVVRLSGESFWHILHDDKKRELTADDLRHAMAVITNPSAIRHKNRSCVFFGPSAGRFWRVALKYVQEADELWLTSFHYKSEREAKAAIESAAKRGEILEREE